jgi:3-oxoacyl-[acyl-carrier protein] reductase
MKISYTGKTVFVSGGTKGIGASIMEGFFNCGATLFGSGTDKDMINDLNLQTANEPRLNYVHLDFTKTESICDGVDVINKMKKIDILVNNAGVNKISPIWDVLEEDWDWIHLVNLKGLYLLTKAIASKMKNQRSGKIINIASIWGVISKAQRSAYSTSKAGLIGFTKAIAHDLAPYNILVNAVSPGFVITELTKQILPEEERNDLAAQVPLKRFAQPEEISNVILFLASDYNTYITGENILIDGGFVNG